MFNFFFLKYLIFFSIIEYDVFASHNNEHENIEKIQKFSLINQGKFS